MNSAFYHTAGDGRWFKRVFATQCRAEILIFFAGRCLFAGRCQGVKGHKGVHWCYGEDGSFKWGDNKKNPQHAGCSGTTPPGHKQYVAPVDMAKRYYLNHSTETEVTNKAKIARLNRGELERNACLSCPAKIDEVVEKALRKSSKKRVRRKSAVHVR